MRRANGAQRDLRRAGHAGGRGRTARSSRRRRASALPGQGPSYTRRALLLLEDYRARLGQVEDRQLRSSLERVIGIFQSSLFQALIALPETDGQMSSLSPDIQEFYEVTLLDNPKSIDRSKPIEYVQPVNTWDFSCSPPSTTVTSEVLPGSLSPATEV
ncbi:hypothetical protein lerEdw1_016470 [Lerista edwardsae]|nr:hypothetical protein lerEdw1_016470 [Lerista edwardsae]